EYLQGNRNPFVDHPEYACKIWGDFNTTTQGICSSYATAPNTITVTPSSSSIAVGSSTTLTASVDTGSSNVTWSSSNNSIATVSGGVVTGVAAGSATITATSTVDTSVKGTATVTVKSLSSLNVSGTPNITSYTAGQSFDSTGLIVTATYSDSSTANVTSSVVWSPDPLTAGTTSVIGSYGNKTVSVSGITVNNNLTVEITKSNSGLSTTASVSNQSKSYNIKDGSTNSGTMSISWGAGSYNSSTYNEFAIKNGTKIQSNDSTYIKTITVDLYGYLNSAVYANGNLVTGVDGTPTSNGYSKVLTYTINSTNWYIVGNSSEHDQFFYSILFNIGTDPSLLTPVTGVSLNESSVTLNINDTVTLIATISPDNASNKNISWSTSNASVATVNDGVVTAVAAGNATITVTTSDGGHTASCAVTVTALTLSNLSYSGTPSNSSYFTGESFDPSGLTVTATYSNSSTANVTSSVIWTPNPLTVGTTSVTGSYTSGGVTKTITVTGISVSDPTLSSISTSGQVVSYSVGDTFSYDGTCTATYTDNSTSVVTPNVDSSSVNMNVAGTYTVTLSFTSGGITKTTTYSVTVTDASNISGTYTLTNKATSYTSVSDAASAEACIDGLNSALTVTAQTNMRFSGSPVTTDMMFGGSTTGASMSIDTTDSNYIVSKIVVRCESYLSTNISTVTCAGMSKEVANYYDGSSSNYADFTFYPLSTSFTVSTVDSEKRIFVNSIEATIVPLSSGADAYGEIFNDCTTGDCSTLSGISDTNWALVSTVYANADSTIKTSIVSASANANGTAIEEAMFRYDMIVAKYSATNFLGRSTSSQSMNVLTNNSALYVIAFLIVGMSSLAGISYLLKKKKYH
ncbi:MAG: Ig-like domain-containing protein, partial [Bacilli bacterium]